MKRTKAKLQPVHGNAPLDLSIQKERHSLQGEEVTNSLVCLDLGCRLLRKARKKNNNVVAWGSALC